MSKSQDPAEAGLPAVRSIFRLNCRPRMVPIAPRIVGPRIVGENDGIDNSEPVTSSR